MTDGEREKRKTDDVYGEEGRGNEMVGGEREKKNKQQQQW